MAASASQLWLSRARRPVIQSCGSPALRAYLFGRHVVRRELTTKLLRAIPGVKLPESDGAFYAFFDVSAVFGKTFGGKVVTSESESAERCGVG